MFEGKFENYKWLETRSFSIHNLINVCPEILRDKFLVISSFDSGSLIPTENESRKGWYSKNNLMYTNRLNNLTELPHEHYDEWYVLLEAKEISITDIFVNYGGFSLRDPEYKLNEADPTWDLIGIKKTNDYERDRQNIFWFNLKNSSAESYIADGDNFIFVTQNKDYFDNVKSKILEFEKIE